jgi:hypothetical protein
MCGREIPVLILDKMKMLDQQIAAARTIGQQSTNFNQGLRIDLSPFRSAGRAAPATAPVCRGSGRHLFRKAHCSPSKQQKSI